MLGQAEASRRLKGTWNNACSPVPIADYVSIKVSATVPPHSPWAFDDAVDHIAANLLPLFTQAATAPTKKFINLDMEEYRDLSFDDRGVTSCSTASNCSASAGSCCRRIRSMR